MTTAAFDPDSPLVTRVVPAANHEPRRLAGGPDVLVLHYTGMRDAERAIAWLATSESRVSCHYVIDEAGQITQLVEEERRAWHAGESYWGGVRDLNSASIGIEIHNPGHELDYREFPQAQIDAVIALSADICARRGIAPWRVLAHSDIAPRRKIDPGEKFPWARLAERGVGHWVAPSPLGSGPGFVIGEESVAIGAVQELFAGYGYDTRRDGVFDDGFEKVVRAFQRHFRPARCDGRLDLSTLATLERLIAALPGGAVSA